MASFSIPRPVLNALHRRLGIVLAPFLLIQALTGALLVVHQLAPAAHGAASAPVSVFVSGALAARPDFRVTRLYLPGSTGARGFAELVSGKGETAYAELDPVNGQALRTGPLWRFPYRAAVQIHYRLATGTAGLFGVTATGMGLMLVALAGFAFWWPGLMRAAKALQIRPGLPARLRLRQQHRSVGAIAAGLAMFSATTGLLLVVPDLLAALTPPAPAATFAPFRPDPTRLDAAVAAGRARFGRAALRDIRFPAADRIDINADAPERSARAVHTVSVRLSDGAVIKAVAAQDNPVLWMKVLPLHTGQSAGWPGAILLLAEAAALAFLAVAGPLMWLDRRRRART